jgi:hypothetical protein
MSQAIRGCSDGNCIIQRPTGMHTNGGCMCWKDLRRALAMDGHDGTALAMRIREALVEGQKARAAGHVVGYADDLLKMCDRLAWALDAKRINDGDRILLIDARDLIARARGAR